MVKPSGIPDGKSTVNSETFSPPLRNGSLSFTSSHKLASQAPVVCSIRVDTTVSVGRVAWQNETPKPSRASLARFVHCTTLVPGTVFVRAIFVLFNTALYTLAAYQRARVDRSVSTVVVATPVVQRATVQCLDSPASSSAQSFPR